MPNIRSSLVPYQAPVLKGKIQIASVLQMSSSDFAKMIEELETSPLFQKFYFSSSEKIIFKKPFNRASLSGQFYELDENALPDSSAGHDTVEKTLESKTHLIERIRKIGRENFEKYFLHNTGEFLAEKTAELCRISLSDVKEINALLDKVYVESEIAYSPSNAASPAVHYTKVAQIVSDGKQGFMIAFFSPRMAQGIYQIDYKKLETLKKAGHLTPEEKKELRSLISKISLINSRKSSLYQLIQKIIKWQSEFLRTGNADQIAPLTQKKVSEEIRVSPSSISRLLYGRSVETPEGNELPLSFFFNSRKEWLKRRVEKIFEENLGLTDNQIRDIIKNRYGIPLSRRSINQYRKELKAIHQQKKETKT